MADLTITAAQVLKSTGAVVETGNAGETITQGQSVYRKAADKEIYKADANVTAAEAAAVGIALNSAADGQPIKFQTDGSITLGAGAAPVEGTVYVVSATAGGIAPVADLVSTNYVTTLGVGNGSNGIDMILKATGSQVP